MLNLWLILFFMLSEHHAIYISVVEMELNDQKADVKVKVFSDDLIDAVKNFIPDCKSTIDEVEIEEISYYFNSHIQLSQEAESLNLMLQNVERYEDSYFFDFSSHYDQNQKLTLSFGYLMELFPSQQNIVKVKKDGETKYFKFQSIGQTEVLE